MQGADPNVMEERSENRPIHYLCRRGNFAGVKYLVEAGADYFALNAGHRNALICASDTSRTGQQVRLVRYLIDLPGYRYKLELRDSGNNTAAICAIFKSNVWILRLLLLAGARVTDDHLLDAGQASAFHIAQWTYAASLLSDIDQLPKSAIRDLDFEQSNCWYRWTSLKGHYTYTPLLFYQSAWKYGQELCYRMCMQKKLVEDREPPVERPKTEVRIMADLLAAKREKRRMQAAIKAAKKAAKEKKLVNRELGNEVRELENWNRQRENMALKVDEEFSKHLRGKGDTSAVEWVRKQVSEQKKERSAVAPPSTKTGGSGGRNKGRTKGGAVAGGGEMLTPIEWESRLRVGSHYITPAPPLPKTKFSKIPLAKFLEQRHNRTHDGKDHINVTVPAEEFYLRASWVEQDPHNKSKREKELSSPETATSVSMGTGTGTGAGDGDQKASGPRAPKYATNSTPDGIKWRLAERNELGLTDFEGKWAQLKMSSPLVVPPVDTDSDGDDNNNDDDDDDVSDVSDVSEFSETKSPAANRAAPSFSSPKGTGPEFQGPSNKTVKD